MRFYRGDCSEEFLQQLYLGMLQPRMIEEKMLVLLRQGKISKWFSGIGQEAISVGVSAALKNKETYYPCTEILGFLPQETFLNAYLRNGG